MKQKILHIPSFSLFDNEWDLLQEFLNRRGNPPYSIGGDLDLFKLPIESLGNLISVGGDLDLSYSKIKSLGNLEYVGGSLFLNKTPLSKIHNIKNTIDISVKVDRSIFGIVESDVY